MRGWIRRLRSRMRPSSARMIRMAARACLKPAMYPPPWNRIQLPEPSILMRLPRATVSPRFRRAAQDLPQAGSNRAPASGRSMMPAISPCGLWGTAPPASWRTGEAATTTTTTSPGIPSATPSGRSSSSPACPPGHAIACSPAASRLPPWTCRAWTPPR